MKSKSWLVILITLACAFAASHFAVHASAAEVTLPHDRGKLFLTVFGDRNDAAFVRLQKDFSSVPELAAVRNETHYNVYTSDSAMYTDLYRPTVSGKLPLVRLQNGTKIVCEFYRGEIPRNPRSLAESLAMPVELHALIASGLPYRLCPNGTCPNGNCNDGNCPDGKCPKEGCIRRKQEQTKQDQAKQDETVPQISVEEVNPWRQLLLPVSIFAFVFIAGGVIYFSVKINS